MAKNQKHVDFGPIRPSNSPQNSEKLISCLRTEDSAPALLHRNCTVTPTSIQGEKRKTIAVFSYSSEKVYFFGS